MGSPGLSMISELLEKSLASHFDLAELFTAENAMGSREAIEEQKITEEPDLPLLPGKLL